MAITALEYLVFKSLKAQNIFPPDPTVLELGKSNWYGDVPKQKMLKEWAEAVDCSAVPTGEDIDAYALAEMFFEAMVGCMPYDYSSIDPGVNNSTYKLDLNEDIFTSIRHNFNVVVSIGTAEHIFNVHQFFKTAHDLTKVGGLMIHSAPWTGWHDHGFYSFQPTFWFDLAEANEYQIVMMVVGRIEPLAYNSIESREQIHEVILGRVKGGETHSTNICTVFRKVKEAKFAIPQQAFYRGVLSEAGVKAWKECR